MWRETSITHSPTDDYMTILYPFAPEPQVHMVYKQTREGAGRSSSRSYTRMGVNINHDTLVMIYPSERTILDFATCQFI